MTEADRMAELQAMKKEIQRSLHCSMPGAVVSYDEASRTAEIRLAGDSLPVLKDVPVFMPVPFTVSPGDLCLVVFADREIDSWLTGVECKSLRMHSLSDGFAFVGFGTAPSVSSQM